MFLRRVAHPTEHTLRPLTGTPHQRPLLCSARLRGVRDASGLAMLKAEIGLAVVGDDATHPMDPRQSFSGADDLDGRTMVGGEKITESVQTAMTASSAASA